MIADLSSSLGFAFGALVPLLLLLCIHQKVSHYDVAWRVALALGAVPPLSIFWFRYRMAVSTAYRKKLHKAPGNTLLAGGKEVLETVTRCMRILVHVCTIIHRVYRPVFLVILGLTLSPGTIIFHTRLASSPLP